MIINCVEIANKIIENFKKDLEVIKNKKPDFVPHMVIIKINNDKASEKYVGIKVKKCEELGIKVTVLGEKINSQSELIKKIKELNNNNSVNGYIIQLPLPKEFDKNEIFENISLYKDIDGLSSLAISRNIINSADFYPKACTANGIIEILKQSNFKIEGKNAVIINRSLIVGKPLIGLLLNENATVTVCHSKTKNLEKITSNADIIICAVGIPNFIKKNMVNKNAFVIDAGISVFNNKVVGDVDFDEVAPVVKYITPVPNGVGKLTVAMIFKNLMDLIKEQFNERI
ncbi:MAG: bifunctional 5,10-methylenetetrahydrofolate dehydrogenase/5,10-methenyltetrahydrofolate cyclohydrolase [Malacoplasma sp.]|nr:bifunctional 5,10-methylenetetrahydrofolate dehydrogenase/5,10-methenyltetrahydrofolate cyclohydrolase [Malacoplasma sp.]